MAEIHTTIPRIEYQTQQQLTIAAASTDDNLSKCNPQEQSILFNKLPLELRELVWQYATAPSEDTARIYDKGAWYYRPGNTARAKYDTALLLTCRRVWIEANAFPMLQADHCFWFYRAAPDGRNHAWRARLTENNRRNFGTLHMYVQMFVIEPLSSRPTALRSYFLKTPEKAGDFQPRIMHVTIRHTDWWYWEHDAPLVFKDSWLQAMLDTPDLRSTFLLKLELETLDYKVDQLTPILERLSNLVSAEYETHIVDGQPATTRFVLQDRREVSQWSSSSRLDGRTYAPYRGRETLNYHVVTLTWRLHFPQLRGVHVPTLRLAPRIGAPAQVSHCYSNEDRANAEIKTSVPSLRTYKRSRLDDVEVFWRFDMDGNLEDLAKLERMLEDQADVTRADRYAADVGEVHRRVSFESEMAKLWTDYWRRRWKAEGSLLSFADDDGSL